MRENASQKMFPSFQNMNEKQCLGKHDVCLRMGGCLLKPLQRDKNGLVN